MIALPARDVSSPCAPNGVQAKTSDEAGIYHSIVVVSLVRTFVAVFAHDVNDIKRRLKRLKAKTCLRNYNGNCGRFSRQMIPVGSISPYHS